MRKMDPMVSSVRWSVRTVGGTSSAPVRIVAARESGIHRAAGEGVEGPSIEIVVDADVAVVTRSAAVPVAAISADALIAGRNSRDAGVAVDRRPVAVTVVRRGIPVGVAGTPVVAVVVAVGIPIFGTDVVAGVPVRVGVVRSVPGGFDLRKTDEAQHHRTHAEDPFHDFSLPDFILLSVSSNPRSRQGSNRKRHAKCASDMRTERHDDNSRANFKIRVCNSGAIQDRKCGAKQ